MKNRFSFVSAKRNPINLHDFPFFLLTFHLPPSTLSHLSLPHPTSLHHPKIHLQETKFHHRPSSPPRTPTFLLPLRLHCRRSFTSPLPPPLLLLLLTLTSLLPLPLLLLPLTLPSPLPPPPLLLTLTLLNFNRNRLCSLRCR